MKYLPFLLLLFTLTIYPQDNLPDIGTLSDITGKTTCYIVADVINRTAIIKTIDKEFRIVNKASEADFFIEYKILSRNTEGFIGSGIETGQLDIYLWRDKQKILAWSDSITDTGGFKGNPASKLVKRFLKARKATK